MNRDIQTYYQRRQLIFYIYCYITDYSTSKPLHFSNGFAAVEVPTRLSQCERGWI